MPKPEPLIEGHKTIRAVIYLEIFVMQVMGIGMAVDLDIIGNFEFVEANMPVQRAIADRVAVEHHHNRIGRDNQMPENLAKIEQVLDRCIDKDDHGLGLIEL